ncbi:MAG: phosphotransferase [Proteobacteria bacterium]|nr:phosphotransferase [Pseudomonadota bacterium]
MNVSSPLKVGTTDFLEEERLSQRYSFLEREGLEKELLIPLPCDASKRRYFRLSNCLLMDAPPPYEDTRRFHLIAQHLQSVGLTIPNIFAADHDRGFLLIEDLGELPYRRAIEKGFSEELLYGETIKSLAHLHSNMAHNTESIASYDLELFIDRACLFFEWYDHFLPVEAKNEFIELWTEVYNNQAQIPQSLIMRDVMVDNLLWLPDRKGMNRCGFIDFQDGLWGPISYDLVSLLEDARRDIQPHFAQKMLNVYFGIFPKLSQEDFWKSYALWGAQRSTRILGVFSRLAKRDGKPNYLAHIPRIWGYLKSDLEHPSLRSLKTWFKKVMP